MTGNAPSEPNRLIHETSPYLLQHAYNPVDWWPWSDEALAKARDEDKVIFLSIGYSACHWCHVMAHESFEDETVARILNERFVPIKVDREERPDLDKIYQIAHQMLLQRPGGWPLSMFLAPDSLAPFFGGTYFPPSPKFGMPAFPEVLERVADFYASNREGINEQNQAVLQAFAGLNPASADDDELHPLPLDGARKELGEGFDPEHGGFHQAPKFPHPTSIERLLRHWALTGARDQADERALEMAVQTLEAMAAGGIYDHVGGGFSRYSVDDQWMIPHFEKMLYDNGPLMALYADAWAATGNETFRRVAEETGEWLLRDMQAPEGGFYSSLDADSEGEEGKFYLWTPEEVRELVGEADYPLVARRYGLDGDANFEGRWHLYAAVSTAQVAIEQGLTVTEADRRIDEARRKLLAARSRRTPPGLDDKILTSWNALAIRGLSVAGRRLGRQDFVDAAERAFDFLRGNLWIDGRLLASYKDGQAHLNAYLDDYAFLLDATLALVEARWRDGDLSFAVTLAECLQTHFLDREHGGFFFTSDDHETLLHRPKPTADEATPAGNGVAARCLQRLGHITGNHEYAELARGTLKACWQPLEHVPSAHGALLDALEEYLNPPQTIVLRGTPEAVAPWQSRCQSPYVPRRTTLGIPDAAQDLPGLLAERTPRGEVVAYVCEGFTCQPPIQTLDELESLLTPLEPAGGSSGQAPA